MTTLTTVSKPKRIPVALNGVDTPTLLATIGAVGAQPELAHHYAQHTEATMSDARFNYSTRAFRQHAKQPGFWRYTLKVHHDGSRFEILLDKATLRRVPIAA